MTYNKADLKKEIIKHFYFSAFKFKTLADLSISKILGLYCIYRNKSRGLRFSLRSLFGKVGPAKSSIKDKFNKSADVSTETILENFDEKSRESTSVTAYDTEDSLMSGKHVSSVSAKKKKTDIGLS